MEPKKFLFYSYEGLIGDIVWQIKKEGNEVKYYIKDRDEREVTDGFVEKVDDFKSHIDWADVIVFDDTLGQGEMAQKLREQGKLVIGGTPYTDKLEDDRAFGQEEMKKHGISILPYKQFTSFDEAMQYVKDNPGRYVIKPNGEASNIKGLLFIGEEEDGRDVIDVLEDYKVAWEKKIPEFQLQKRVSGVEIAVSAFFNGKEFLNPININFEHKKLFPGNLGPNTGEMGTSIFWSTPNRLFNQTLKKLEATLAKEKYVGAIDLNCIVNGYGIYPLEFTARFGYPIIMVMQDSMITPIGELLYEMAKGNGKNFKVKNGFHIGVRIVVPPFPFHDKQTFNAKSKDSVIFLKKTVEGIHIEDVKKINEQWVVTGTAGVVLVVCGSGMTMRQAIDNAYHKIKFIKIPHMYYRDDIGERWFEDSDRLHSWGYLREL